MPVVCIPTRLIINWQSFHEVFTDVLGFPPYYGRNMDAWIDCLTYVDEPVTGMTQIVANPGDILTLRIEDVADFACRCPDQYKAIIECSAFVNERRIDVGERSHAQP